MMSHWTGHLCGESRSRIVIAAMAIMMLAAPMPSAWSQNRAPAVSPQTAPSQAPQPPTSSDPPPPEQASPAPPPRENPGLINEIGKLFDKPGSIFPSLPSLPSFPGLKTPGEAIDDLNARAKDAGDALPRLTTMVKGRVACPVAANGAPDCKAASDKLCQRNGFKEGKSLDTDSAQSCSAKSLLTGGKPAEGECRTENYVTRALCQ